MARNRVLRARKSILLSTSRSAPKVDTLLGNNNGAMATLREQFVHDITGAKFSFLRFESSSLFHSFRFIFFTSATCALRFRWIPASPFLNRYFYLTLRHLHVLHDLPELHSRIPPTPIDMATATKTFTRALPRTAAVSSARLATRSAHQPTLAQQFFRSSRRNYSSRPASSPSSKAGLYIGGAAVAALGAGGYFYWSTGDHEIPEVHLRSGSAGQSAGIFKPSSEDYQKVR